MGERLAEPEHRLLCVAVLTVLLFSICYWSLGRLLQEEEDKVSFHFTRLIGDIREHEAFLVRIARKSDKATQKHDHDVVPLQRRLLAREEGVEVYEGREFSFAMPFLLATRHGVDRNASWGRSPWASCSPTSTAASGAFRHTPRHNC
ncbi:hypothetical protein [Pseudomonas aeruginosa]|uniref:hypothetical protein n=1 Tax=Pseudomonas aeruginosa TaxID=287 RepID=UPI0021111F59|nr:hypothetical protein [Pseudomonas aeruginosa]MCT9627675.1 hypothetical protein [Pseudomonas aeruginosa]